MAPLVVPVMNTWRSWAPEGRSAGASTGGKSEGVLQHRCKAGRLPA